MPAQRPLEPGTRHLEDVAVAERTIRIEPRLERAARRGTIVHGHPLRRSVPLDAHLNKRPVRRAADLEVGQVQTQRRQPGPERLDETVGEHKKKRGPNFARFTARNLAGQRRVSSERHTHVGDHSPVPSARRAVGEEPIPVVGSAPRGDADLSDAELSRLPDQDGTEVHTARGIDRSAGPGALSRGQPLHDFRTYFIARAANTYSTMHYDIRGAGESLALEELDAALQDAPCHPAPPR